MLSPCAVALMPGFNETKDRLNSNENIHSALHQMTAGQTVLYLNIKVVLSLQYQT